MIVDACYEKLIYDAVPHNLPRVLDTYCRDLAVICGSASKAYAMTGWRCGWTLAPAAGRCRERHPEPRDVERFFNHPELSSRR